VRDDDRQVGEVDGDIVEVQRVGVLQPDPTTAGQTRADPGLAAVEERGYAELLQHLVERVGSTVVGIERLDAGVELEAAHPELLDQPSGLGHSGLSFGGVDAGERKQHVGVAPGPLDHRLVGDPGVAQRRLRVDGEDHRRHLPLAVVVRELVERRRSAALDPEVLVRAGPEVLGQGEVAAPVGLGVRVHVDGGECRDVEARCVRLGQRHASCGWSSGSWGAGMP
jgi:hypothetical protein